MGKHRKPTIPDSERMYEEGYRKAPLATRFGPGNNANPKGRPKKTAKSEKQILEEIKAAPVQVVVNGETLVMSSIEFALRNAMNRAMKDERGRALRDFITIDQRYGGSIDVDDADVELSAEDQAILDRHEREILERNGLPRATPTGKEAAK